MIISYELPYLHIQASEPIKPANYLCLAILSIFICLPFGLIALFYSTQVILIKIYDVPCDTHAHHNTPVTSHSHAELSLYRQCMKPLNACGSYCVYYCSGTPQCGPLPQIGTTSLNLDLYTSLTVVPMQDSPLKCGHLSNQDTSLDTKRCPHPFKCWSRPEK